MDGRSYPDHLRPYETYDETLLPLLDGYELTFDELVGSVADRRMQASVPRWLASAEWRGWSNAAVRRGTAPGRTC